MREKCTLQTLSDGLARRNDCSKAKAEIFCRSLFSLIKSSLNSDSIVKIKGLGTFKMVTVNNRESINVNTGERIEISEHSRVIFTPDKVLKERVNRPFEKFTTIIIDDDDIQALDSNKFSFEGEEPDMNDAVSAEEELKEIPAIDAQPDSETEEKESEVESNDEPQPETEIPVESNDEPQPETEIPVEEEGPKAEEPKEEAPKAEEPKAEEPKEEEPKPEEPKAVETVPVQETPKVEMKAPEIAEVRPEVPQASQVVIVDVNPEVEEQTSVNEDIQPVRETVVPKVATAPRPVVVEERTAPVVPQPQAAPVVEEKKEEVKRTVEPATPETPVKYDDEPETPAARASIPVFPDFEDSDSEEDTDDSGSDFHIAKVILGILFFVIIMAACYFAGYFKLLGNFSIQRPQVVATAPVKVTVKKEVVVKEPAKQTAEVPDTNKVTQKAPVEPEEDVQQLSKKYDQMPGEKYLIVGELKSHVLEPGETLLKLSRKVYGKSEYVKYIVFFNGYKNPDNVTEGSKVKLPKLAHQK